MNEPHPATSTRTTTAAPLLADRYRLNQPLGRGATAQLYQAHDELLNRPVAVKVFRPETGAPGADLPQQPEIRALAGLQHPGLVAVFDAGTDQPGTPAQRSFMVLELVRGTTLAQRIHTGPLPPGQVGALGEHLATTLAYLHTHGVVHPNITPASVLLGTPQPGDPAPLTAKLSDVGISPATTGSPTNERSPEHATGEEAGPAGDIYALALLLLECLTGHRPDPGVGSAAGRGHQPPVIPEELDPGWARLLAAMTHPDPTHRPTADDVADALDELTAAPTALTESPPPTGLAAIGLRHHPRATTRHRRPRRRWWALPVTAARRKRALGAFPTRSVIAVVVAATFAAGVLSLVNDAAVTTTGAPPAAAPAAPAPSSALPTPPAPSSPPPTTAATPPPPPMFPAPTAAPVAAPITYTVAPGDNLSTIAWWFHTHGYGGLYEANKAVLGDDPNLIHPGQQITITNNGMTVG